MTLPPRCLLNPRYWLAWVTISIFWSLSHLPYRWQLSIGRWLGRRFLLLAQRKRYVAEVNIELCFPDWTPDQRARLLKRNFEASGIALIETAMGWWASDHRLRSLFTIHGIEHLFENLKEGRGVILCSAHFLSMELAGRFLTIELPFAVVYRSQKHGVVDYVARQCRTRHYQKLIAHDDIHGILTTLGENQIVWYTPDVDPGRKSKGVFVPFFGVSAYSTNALARIARLSGAAVVPGFPYRREDGTGYDLVLNPPLHDFPSNDPIHDTARVNQWTEQAIRRCPEQYLWQYKRFKVRPPGEKRVYEPQ
jgi:Kdo2-lipid IVA lauroyltransferase/acyltransferase